MRLLISRINLFIFEGGQLNIVCSNAEPDPNRRKMRDNRHWDSVRMLLLLSQRPMRDTTKILGIYSSNGNALYALACITDSDSLSLRWTSRVEISALKMCFCWSDSHFNLIFLFSQVLVSSRSSCEPFLWKMYSLPPERGIASLSMFGNPWALWDASDWWACPPLSWEALICFFSGSFSVLRREIWMNSVPILIETELAKLGVWQTISLKV